MKRPYELTYIVRIDSSNEGLDGQIRQVHGWITEEDQGRILREEVWGRRKLAYEIEHQSEGFYIHYLAEIETSVLPELEQNLELAPDILRYLIVRAEEAEIEAFAQPEAAETAATGSEDASADGATAADEVNEASEGDAATTTGEESAPEAGEDDD